MLPILIIFFYLTRALRAHTHLYTLKKISLLFSASSERWPRRRRGRSNDANVIICEDKNKGKKYAVTHCYNSKRMWKDVCERRDDAGPKLTLSQKQKLFAGELGPGHIWCGGAPLQLTLPSLLVVLLRTLVSLLPHHHQHFKAKLSHLPIEACSRSSSRQANNWHAIFVITFSTSLSLSLPHRFLSPPSPSLSRLGRWPKHLQSSDAAAAATTVMAAAVETTAQT